MFDNVTTDEMCPQLLEMVTQLQKENKELKEENKALKMFMSNWRLTMSKLEEATREAHKEVLANLYGILDGHYTRYGPLKPENVPTRE
eukprot:COSAG06_NODE_1804_length_8360_cov_8.543155_2_plen_88_part_00